MDNYDVQELRMRNWQRELAREILFGSNRNRNTITAEDAFIESIERDNRTIYVTISYGVPGNRNMINMELVRLVVDRNTVIRDMFGNALNPRDLREGMRIDAVFSAAMTRSIPPQSRAYRITVIGDSSDFAFSEGRVLEVDTRNGFLLTGNPFDTMSQIRYVVTDSTTIRDRRGRTIRLRDLRPRDFVRVMHATFMTMSIPPQTTAFEIQVL